MTVATSLLLYDFVFNPSSIFPGLALICFTTGLAVFNYFQLVCALAVMLLLKECKVQKQTNMSDLNMNTYSPKTILGALKQNL